MLTSDYNALLLNDAQTTLEPVKSLLASKRKIVIAASGSRGDVQPYIAFGLHLKARGHRVVIATERRIESLVKEFNLEYTALEGDPTGALFEPNAQKILKEGSVMKLMKLTEEHDKKFSKDDILASYVNACKGADLIIAAALTLTQTFCVAEMMNIPWIPVILGPTLPTSEFPIWAFEKIIPCSCLNKWSYNLLFKMLWSSEKKFINPWRVKQLGLPPIDKARGIADMIDDLMPPVIIACSPLVSGPNRAIPRDYAPNCIMEGFVFVESSTDKDIKPDLINFLNNDPSGARPGGEKRPVIYLGFGSMPTPNPLELVQMAVDICVQAECRAVLVTGWSDFGSNPAAMDILAAHLEAGTIFSIKAVAHDWLFPKMNCILHHCGVGTMAAALRSGVPQIPCPVMLDQPHNGHSVLSLGCALTVVPYDKLSARKITTELKRVFANEKEVVTVAAQVGEEVRLEADRSLDIYCDIVDSYVKREPFCYDKK